MPFVFRHEAAIASRTWQIVTIAKRPSHRARDGRACRDDLPDGLSEIFLCEGLDRNFRKLPDGQITSLAPKDGAPMPALPLAPDVDHTSKRVGQVPTKRNRRSPCPRPVLPRKTSFRQLTKRYRGPSLAALCIP